MKLLTLVVIDDYPLEGETIEFLLKKERPDITYCGQALSGQAGKELILKYRPDIAIVDVKMPEIDGLTLTQEIRALAPETKIIITSAFGDFSFVQSAIRLGACDYLLKPMSPEELYQAIDRAAASPASAGRQTQMEQISGGITLRIPEALIAAIQKGNSQESAEQFQDFWTRYTEGGGFSFRENKLAASYFLSQLLEQIEVPDTSARELIQEEENYLYRHHLTQLPGCLDCGTIQKNLSDYVQSLADIRNYRFHETGDEQIERAKAIIEKNLGKKITLKMVAQEIFISPFYLSNLFKKRTGVNFIDYVIGRRIEKSKQLLLTTNDTIEVVAAQVGYDESNYFRRLFKKTVGVSPREFRRQNLSRLAGGSGDCEDRAQAP